jgi:endoglucanase
MPRLNYEGVNFPSGAWDVGYSTTPLGYYYYPSVADVDWAADKGVNFIRFMMQLNHLTDDTKADDIAALRPAIERAQQRGITCMISTGGQGHVYQGTQDWGLAGVTPGATERLRDMWVEFVNDWKQYPHLWWGLMNEPEQAPSAWLTAANAIIAAIRQAGSNHKIIVPGGKYDQAAFGSWGGWTGNASVMGGVVDPANNFHYEIHGYLDAGGGGGSFYGVSGGTPGATILQDATQWARQRGVKFVLGEFGWDTDAASMAEGRAMWDYMHANSDVWEACAWWVAGPGISSYSMWIGPTSPDRVQYTQILSEYSAASPVTPGPSQLPVLSAFDSTGTFESAGVITLGVGKQGSNGQPSSVKWRTVNSSAKGGQDFVASSGTLTFAPTETSKTITITLLNDTIAEDAYEGFLIELYEPVNCTISDAWGWGSIRDDPTDGDAAPPPTPTPQPTAPHRLKSKMTLSVLYKHKNR